MILKYIYFISPEHASSAVSTIEFCIKDVFSLLLANKLSANPNKTDYLFFNSRNINPQVIIINLDSDIISPSYSAKNLGVLFQSDMLLDNLISTIIQSCFVQLRDFRDFRRIRPLISKTAAITLANSLIYSRLDYNNSLFYGLIITLSTVCKRFKIQLLALSVARSARPLHITPVLKSLH